MTNTKSTKRALLASAMALLLCFSMLLSTTFAWFTDSVTSGNNIIKSGNLDIELEYWNGSDWLDVKDASKILTNELWEPGVTEVAYLKVKNAGSLVLKYQLGINILSEIEGVNQAGKTFKLSDYILFGVVENVNGETDSYATTDAGRAEAIADVTDAKKISAGYTKSATMNPNNVLYLALVVYMPTGIGNDANHNGTVPQIDLGINVLATQMTAENDSFNDQYDTDAAFGTYIELDAGDDLLAAMLSAEQDKPLTIKLNGDVEWLTEGHHGENDITPASSIIIDGNGYTITATGAGVTPLGDQTAPMTLKNVKIVDNSVSYNEGAWEFTYLEIGGSSLTCNNVTFADEIQLGTNAIFTNCSFESNEESVYAVWVEDGAATFNNCTFTGYRGLKVHEDYGTEIRSVVVKNCTFSNLTKKPGVALGNIYMNGNTYKSGNTTYTNTTDTSISITGCTFINCQAGDQGLYIYETDTAVTEFDFTNENNTVLNGNEVAEGLYYDTTEKTFTIASKAGLMNLNEELAKVAPSEANIQKVNLLCDVDLAGETWMPIDKMWVNFYGNGHTISNINACFDSTGRRSGFWGYAGAVSINDLTLHNVTVAGSQAGTFAGAAEGLKINNCVLSGTNTVTYVDGVEDWNGIGAITGVLTNSNINVTIVEGATVQLIKDGFETATGCTFQDNWTGYIQANSGIVVNNGTVKVIDLAIATADELFAFANDVNVNGNNYSGKTVALVADIDLENKAWTPIGQTGATEFRGTFDGQNYTIKNLNVDNTAYTDEHTSTGLFGWAERNVTIKNVKVDGANVKGNHNVAVIVGYTYSGKIINCHVSNATVECYHANEEACGDKAGTIAGYTADEARITNCSATGSTVKAGRDAGQIVGLGYTNSVSGCSATGVTVSANSTCDKEANIRNEVIGRVMG